jgi:hypothetical protein
MSKLVAEGAKGKKKKEVVQLDYDLYDGKEDKDEL